MNKPDTITISLTPTTRALVDLIQATTKKSPTPAQIEAAYKSAAPGVHIRPETLGDPLTFEEAAVFAFTQGAVALGHKFCRSHDLGANLADMGLRPQPRFEDLLPVGQVDGLAA